MTLASPTFLGMDIGTSSVKVALFDARGAPLAVASRRHATTFGPDGQAEQNPLDWWSGACEGAREVIARAGSGAARIAAVGLSGQITTQVLLGPDGEAIRPALTWQDTRAHAEAEELFRTLGADRLRKWLAIDLPVGANWPAPKLLWLRRHEPDSLDRAAHLVEPKGYVLHRLTGEYAGDASSGRGLVSQVTGRVPAALAQAWGLRPEIVPPVRAPHSFAGRVTAAAADATCVPTGTPVVLGWNDLNCAVLGTGAVSTGIGFDLTGTSEHIGVPVADLPGSARPEGLMSGPFLEGLRLLYGVTMTGGAALDWYASRFRHEGEGLSDRYGRLLALAAQAPAGSERLLFLPYLHGERSPIWDALARGAFVGVSATHGEGHFARAILEGVAYSLGQVLALVSAAAVAPREIRVSGGAGGLPLWNQIKADVLGVPVGELEVGEAACLGAAMLAAIGAGAYRNAREAASAMVRVKGYVQPDGKSQALYAEYGRLYQRLYPALREVFHALAALPEAAAADCTCEGDGAG